MDCSYGSCCKSTTQTGIVCEQRAVSLSMNEMPEEGAWQIDQTHRSATIYHQEKLTIHQQMELIQQLQSQNSVNNIKLFTFLYGRLKQESIQSSQLSSINISQPYPSTDQQQTVHSFQPQRILFINGGQISYPHLHAGNPQAITMEVVEVPQSPLKEGLTLINRDSLIGYTSLALKPTLFEMNLHCKKVLSLILNSHPPRRFVFLIQQKKKNFNQRSSLIMKQVNRLLLLVAAKIGKSNVRMIESYLKVEKYMMMV